MKTFEQFAEEKEMSRTLRPGEEGYNPNDHYLGILYENERYTLIEGPRLYVGNVSFTALIDSLCDLLEECPRVKFELNFSDSFPEHERDLLERMTELYKIKRLAKK